METASPSIVLPTDAVPMEKAIPVINVYTPAASNSNTGLLIIIKQSSFSALEQVMNSLEITHMSIAQVLSRNVAKDSLVPSVPQVQVDITIATHLVPEVIEAAKKALYTGHIGDGKIFVYDAESITKVKSYGNGYSAQKSKAEC